MTLVSFANIVFSLSVIVLQIAMICALVYLIFFRKEKNTVATFLGKHGILLVFLISLIAMCGSLFYSNVVGFTPCDLCWFQRIFIYPQVFLLGLALVKKDRHIIDYSILLAIVGGVISLYHNYIYYYAGGLNVYCQLGGMQVSCIKRYVFEFGYVTIPMMALTVFVLTIILLIFAKLYYKSNQ